MPTKTLTIETFTWQALWDRPCQSMGKFVCLWFLAFLFLQVCQVVFWTGVGQITGALPLEAMETAATTLWAMNLRAQRQAKLVMAAHKNMEDGYRA